jgi:hypothetical protein
MSDYQSDLKRFLDAMTIMTSSSIPEGYYHTIYSFVREYGIIMKPYPLPVGVSRGTPKECYQNATLLALGNRKLTYCEGFAIGKGSIPMEHAWNLKDDKVLDVTWGEGAAYIGIPFKTDYLRAALDKASVYGLINAYENDWPLLKMSRDEVTQCVVDLTAQQPKVK